MAEISAAQISMSEMSVSEFVEFLRHREIDVRAHDGRLKISAPKGAMDGFLQAELKRRKPELLELLTQRAPAPALAPLSDVELKGRIPLTPAQQGMWLIEHFSPGNVAYNISEAFWIEREVDRAILQAAVDEMVARHRILRTSFHEIDGELFQTIAESVDVPLDFTDLSAFSAEESDRQCRETIRKEGRRPFRLEQVPLVRFHLFRMAESRYVVSFHVHHILADRVSLYVMREELVALSDSIYRAKHAPAEHAEMLPANPIQYAEYAVWLDALMRSEAISRQIAYWKNRLAGVPPFVELRRSLPWPAKRSEEGGIERITVPGPAAKVLRQIGTEEGASPFMTFLAVYAVLIARSSRNTEEGADFCIGSPVTHRRQPETQRMIGLFVNMLAFRCTVAPRMSFRELLRQVRGTALEAYENSEVPFQRLVRALKPDRRSRRSPIFQVMFGYETYLPPVIEEMRMDVYPGTARYDLSLHLAESAGDVLYGAIEYCTDLFTGEDAAKLARDFEAIVGGIASGPDQQVWTLPL